MFCVLGCGFVVAYACVRQCGRVFVRWCVYVISCVYGFVGLYVWVCMFGCLCFGVRVFVCLRVWELCCSLFILACWWIMCLRVCGVVCLCISVPVVGLCICVYLCVVRSISVYSGVPKRILVY